MVTEKSEYNLSFAGCGFLGLYHAGVCGCIQEFAPQLYKGQKVSGASAGAIAAAFLVCDVNLSDCVQYLMQTINSTRPYILGPFDPRFKITQLLREGLDMYLPDDAHIRCSGHLFISMTNQTTNENYIARNYKDRNELIKAILCSSYIPIFSGFIPLTFRGEWMIDGALTKNMLVLDHKTITISPFSGEADICPRDDWDCGQIFIAGTSFLVNPNNIQRIINIFWPKSPEELGKLTQLGYTDALHFLARNGFIKCDLHRCHTVFMNVKVSSEQIINDKHCKKCRQNTKIALESELSGPILSSFTPIEYAVEKQLIKYFRIVSNVFTIPIVIAFQYIDRCLSILRSSPRHLIGSLLDVAVTLTSLDEILKKALSKAIEFNFEHNIVCKSLEDITVTSDIDYTWFLYNKESIESESVESLFDNSEHEMLVQKIVDDNEIQYCENQTEDLKEESLENIKMKSNWTDSLRTRSEYFDADSKKMKSILIREEINDHGTYPQMRAHSECTIPHSIDDVHPEMDHQMIWSYTNVGEVNEINYCILTPLLDSDYTT